MTVLSSSSSKPARALDRNLTQVVGFQKSEYADSDFKSDYHNRANSIFKSISEASKLASNADRVDCVMRIFSSLSEFDHWARSIGVEKVLEIDEGEVFQKMPKDLSIKDLQSLIHVINKSKKFNLENYIELLNKPRENLNMQIQAEVERSLEKRRIFHEVSSSIHSGMKRLLPSSDSSISALWSSQRAKENARSTLDLDEIEYAFSRYYQSINPYQPPCLQTANQGISTKRLKKIKFDELVNVNWISATCFAKDEFYRVYKIYQDLKTCNRVDPLICPDFLLRDVQQKVQLIGCLIVEQETGFCEVLKEFDPSLFRDMEVPEDMLNKVDLSPKARLHHLDKKFQPVEDLSLFQLKVKQLADAITTYEPRIQERLKTNENSQ